jgi:hypothetical protein
MGRSLTTSNHVSVKLRRIAALAGLLLVGLGTASAAHAAPRAFYGLIPANDPSPTEIKRMGTGGVGTLRINLYWGAVQPTRGAPYDWRHYDQIVGVAALNGIRVLPTVYGSPGWVARRPNLPPNKHHWADFRHYVAAAAQRYGRGGIFWQEHPAIPRLPIVWWQLWNEVNSPSFWYRNPKPKQYVRLLRKFHAGIKAGDPSARIVLSGLFPTPQVKHGMTGDDFLRGIYRSRGKRLFDAAALHPYSTTPKQALTRVKDMRRTMGQFKDRRAKIWVTELGWATGGPRTPLTVSRKRQAKYLHRSYQLLAKNRRRLKIPGVIWYSWRDVPGGGIWFQHTGLFNASFAAKPSWFSLVRLTGGRP